MASVACLAQSSPPNAEARLLEAGKPIASQLQAKEKHSYQLMLSSSQFVQVMVAQLSLDVVVTLYDADGKMLLEVDNPSDGEEPEVIYWLADKAGTFRIEVRPAEQDAKAGRYEIKLAALRTATEQDKKRVAAEVAFFTGERQFEEAKPASYQFARRQYELAAPLFQELSDRKQEARVHYQLGLTCNKLNEKTQALEHFKQAQRLRHALKDRFGEAAAWSNQGTIYYELSEPRKAIDAHSEALKLRREVKDRVGEAITLNGLGVAYREIGENQKALQHYLLALQLRRDLKDRAGEAVTLSNLGVIYDELGEVQKMLDAYSEALPLRREARGRAITLTNIGQGYERLGLPEEALNYYRQALPLARSVSDKLWEARILNFMGLAYQAVGDYQAAHENFNQALPLYREAKNPAGEASTLNNLGLVYDAQKLPRQALQAYQQALPLAREAKNRQYEAHILNNLGFVSERLGNKLKAFEQHQQALQISRAIGDRRRAAKAHYGLARIEREQGKLKQARAQIEQTIEIVESLRAKLDSPEIRAAYRATTQQYYDLYIDVLMRLDRQQPKNKHSVEALQVSERARARSLIEMLSEVGANLRQGVDAGLVERERELQEQLNNKTTEQLKLLSGKPTPEQGTALVQELESLASTLRDTQAQLRRSSPRFAALTQPEPLTVRQMQEQLLDANTLLLEYALGEEHSYLWAMTTNSLHSFTLPKRAVIEAAARRYYELLTARNDAPPNESSASKQTRVAHAEAESRTAGRALSQMLLGPVAAQLGNKRLVIVADGALQYVPFAALPAPELRVSGFESRGQNNKSQTSNRETRNAKLATIIAQPLIVQHEIINLPSASTLAALRREEVGRKPAAKIAVVIADPVFDNKDERVKTIAIGASTKVVAAPAATPDTARILLLKTAKASGLADAEARIPRLPNTRREAEAILALLNPTEGRAAFDFAANRRAAMNDELGNYRIIHFATHGFLNSSNPQLSGLVLSLVDEKGTAQNGFLLAPEIYQLKLSATELVVLSACQTGLGQEIRGEGVIGLTRGFMYAGAPRVVVSLWNVSDQATADLMKLFYKAMLKRGMRPAAALRTAQIALWKQQKWRAPYYWAAFGLQGEWR